MSHDRSIAGVILAGGAGSRLGGNKALLDLGGKPMVQYTIDSLAKVTDMIVIVGSDRVEANMIANAAHVRGPGPPYGKRIVVAWDARDDPTKSGGESDTPCDCSASESGVGRVKPSQECRGDRVHRRSRGDRSTRPGPLAGIAAGLAASGAEWCVVVGCDMPFVSIELIRYMLGRCCDEGCDDGVDAVVPRLGPVGALEPLCAVYSARCLPHVRQLLAAGARKATDLFKLVRTVYVGRDVCEEHDPKGLSFFNVNTLDDLAIARRIVAAGEESDGPGPVGRVDSWGRSRP